jgi:hypothetical protein
MIETPLERFARRASAEPSFLGWQLAAFARARGLDDKTLAAHLGCPVATLAHVRLCGAIRIEHFRDDVTCVAEKFGLNPQRLAEAAKTIPAKPACEVAPADAECVPSPMLAARDRSEAQ